MSNSPTDDLFRGSLQLVEHLQRCGLTCMPRPSEAWSAWPSLASRSLAATPSSLLPPVASTALPSKQLMTAPVPPESVDPRPSVREAPPQPAAVALATANWASPPCQLPQRAEQLQQLRDEVRGCQRCPELAKSRTQTVFGVGHVAPRVVFFGEAPGADEDRQGEPFVGAAGQLLNKIIQASQMKREEVYILNSLKCRPPANRTPVDPEIANCRPFFERQLEILQPEFIVCLGAVAARAVLQSTESVGRLRGRFHAYRAAKVLVTYHPAYLLRTESAKRFVWEDMQMLMAALGLKLPSPNKP
jgi:uracil-DNA glycosylase family 4